MRAERGQGRQSAGAARAAPGPRTYLVPGRQVLILVARVPLLPVQEEEVDHLLLILPAEGERRREAGWGPCRPAPPPPGRPPDALLGQQVLHALQVPPPDLS